MALTRFRRFVSLAWTTMALSVAAASGFSAWPAVPAWPAQAAGPHTDGLTCFDTDVSGSNLTASDGEPPSDPGPVFVRQEVLRLYVEVLTDGFPQAPAGGPARQLAAILPMARKLRAEGITIQPVLYGAWANQPGVARQAMAGLAAVDQGHLVLAATPLGMLRGALSLATVADARDGLTLDARYELSGEPPEAPIWIGRSAARLRATSQEEPYRVRLAQVPASTSDTLHDQILHPIQTAVGAAEDNRMQLVELTYAFCADEVLRADPRRLRPVLTAILPNVSNPQLGKAIATRLAKLDAAVPHLGDRVGENGRSRKARQQYGDLDDR